MPIIKSLHGRVVSSEEALAYHLAHISPEELTELRQGRSWRAERFVSRFQAKGLLAVVRDQQNDYERAVTGIAEEVQAVGSAACSQQCGLCVSAVHLNPLEHPQSQSFLKVVCAVDGCPESGLRAVEAQYAAMPARAADELRRFDGPVLADPQPDC